MVKNQNLNFKIPDSMAITILYGNNKADKTNESSFSFNNPDMMKLFGRNTGLEYDDRYLYNLTTPGISNDDTKKTFAKVGSENINHNSRIIEGEGLNIQPQTWWQQWVGENKVVKEDPTNTAPRVKFEIDPENDQIVYMKEEFDVIDEQLELTEEENYEAQGGTTGNVLIESQAGSGNAQHNPQLQTVGRGSPSNQNPRK